MQHLHLQETVEDISENTGNNKLMDKFKKKKMRINSKEPHYIGQRNSYIIDK